jgi:hypothetical protein
MIINDEWRMMDDSQLNGILMVHVVKPMPQISPKSSPFLWVGFQSFPNGRFDYHDAMVQRHIMPDIFDPDCSPTAEIAYLWSAKGNTTELLAPSTLASPGHINRW